MPATYGIDPDRLGIYRRLSRRSSVADAGNGRRQWETRRRRTRSTSASSRVQPPSPASSRRRTSSTTASPRRGGDRPRHPEATYAAPFDFHAPRPPKTKPSCRSPTNRKRSPRSPAAISPINHVSADDPPTLILHGDADTLVPLQQSEIDRRRSSEAAGVDTKLVVQAPVRAHGWLGDGPGYERPRRLVRRPPQEARRSQALRGEALTCHHRAEPRAVASHDRA